MKITLDALLILDAIDTRGSFSAAAAALNRVPSAITHAVAKLEDDLGFPLFDRVGRRAHLNAAGRGMLEDGRAVLRAAGELECRARRVATGWEPELAIAVNALVDARSLFPLIERFYAEAGPTRLRLSTEVLGGCWDALATGRADLAIGATDGPPASGYLTRPLAEVEFAFCVAPHHPLADAPEPLTDAALRPHRVVAIADSSRALAARSFGLQEGERLTVADHACKLAAQRAGLGVGHLPRGEAEREAAAGRLVIKTLAAPMPSHRLHLAWRARQEGKALAWLSEHLQMPQWRPRMLGDPLNPHQP